MIGYRRVLVCDSLHRRTPKLCSGGLWSQHSVLLTGVRSSVVPHLRFSLGRIPFNTVVDSETPNTAKVRPAKAILDTGAVLNIAFYKTRTYVRLHRDRDPFGSERREGEKARRVIFTPRDQKLWQLKGL